MPKSWWKRARGARGTRRRPRTPRRPAGPMGSRLARMRAVRADHTAGRITAVEGVERLRGVYPSLAFKDDGAWWRLLTDPEQEAMT